MKKVLDHGFVELVDHMPQENLDKAIVDGARVSYQTGTKTTRGDRGLIRYLVRNWHTSPLELVVSVVEAPNSLCKRDVCQVFHC
jgi:thymidylate synthase (FAD)